MGWSLFPARGGGPEEGRSRAHRADSRDELGRAAPHGRPSPGGGLAQGGQRGGRASVPRPQRAFLGQRVPMPVPHVSSSRPCSEVTLRRLLRVSVSRCDFPQNARRLEDVSHFVLWYEARRLGNQRPLPLWGVLVTTFALETVLSCCPRSRWPSAAAPSGWPCWRKPGSVSWWKGSSPTRSTPRALSGAWSLGSAFW